MNQKTNTSRQFNRLIEADKVLFWALLNSNAKMFFAVAGWLAAGISSIVLTQQFINGWIGWLIAFLLPFAAFFTIEYIAKKPAVLIKIFLLFIYACLFVINSWTIQGQLAQNEINNKEEITSDENYISLKNQIGEIESTLNKNKTALAELAEKTSQAQANHLQRLAQITADKNQQIKNCATRYKSRKRIARCQRAEDLKESKNAKAENKNFSLLLGTLTEERKTLNIAIKNGAAELARLRKKESNSISELKNERNKSNLMSKLNPKLIIIALLIAAVSDFSLFILFNEKRTAKSLKNKKRQLRQQLDSIPTAVRQQLSDSKTAAQWHEEIVQKIQNREFKVEYLSLRKASRYAAGNLSKDKIAEIFEYCAENNWLDYSVDRAGRRTYFYPSDNVFSFKDQQMLAGLK